MQAFRKVFGTSSASAEKGTRKSQQSTTMTIESIEALTQKEEHLEKRRSLMEKRIEEELENAKKYNKQNKKNQALLCLKKKKMYEKNVEDLGNLIMKVNEQKILLENAQTTAETLKAIEGATKASQSVLKDNQIDNVDKMMEDITTATDTMQEINERIAEPTSFMADYDNDDLLKELEDMDAEMLDEELLAPIKHPAAPERVEELPSVPETKVPATASAEKPMSEDDQEFAKLVAEFS